VVPMQLRGRCPQRTFNVPENDFFATVDELESRDFIYDRKYFNIERGDDQ
jgi:hypothetical protein